MNVLLRQCKNKKTEVSYLRSKGGGYGTFW